MAGAPAPDGQLGSMPIGCTLRITADGAITVQRDRGCTPQDVRDLCALVGRGEVEVIDLTR